MSRYRHPRAKTAQKKAQRLNNNLQDLSTSLGMRGPGMTGGSYLSSYNTQAFSNNYSLLTFNRIILTYMYVGNGIFQTAVQLPIQDAIGKGIEIESGELDGDDIKAVLDKMEDVKAWESILDYFTWVRLYGGGALLVNCNQDPAEPLNLRTLQGSPLEFYDLDRWQMETGTYVSMGQFAEYTVDPNGSVNINGEEIHESRFMRSTGKRAPHYVRQQLRGWGMSEGERMVRDLNLYMKTQDATFELIDEAKLDIYHIKQLASRLITSGGVAQMTQRVQAANEIKNYVNALVLDEDEQYEQKVINFAGLSEVMNQNRMGVAAALRMPLTKLFGLSASGFNTGESDLENYNAMVDSDVRKKLNPVVRKVLKIIMADLFGYIPQFTFTWPSLRELTPKDEQEVKTSEHTRNMDLYDRGLLTAQEFMQMERKAGVVDIETETEKGINTSPVPPQGPESVDSDPFQSQFNSLTWSGHKLQGKKKIQGLEISIENKKGSVRKGVDPDGHEWKTKFKFPYGYIRGTEGTDGDHVDCYIGPNEEAKDAFIVHQNFPDTGKFDEDKVMLGFDSKAEAVQAYKDHYDKPGFFGGVSTVSMDKLKKLLKAKKGKMLNSRGRLFRNHG